MTDKRDYYEILGISRDASQDEIKKAYRNLARKHHPDVNRHDEGAEERFKEINEAYSILSDSDKRSRYDQYGHDAANGRYADPGMGDMGGFGDIFDMFFGGGGGGRTRRRSAGEDGADLRYDVEITLEEVSTGVEKNLKLTRMRTCETCSGTGARSGSAPQACSHCHGTGQVRRSQHTVLGSFSTVTDCTHCRGTGYIILDPCPDCSGQGRVRKSNEQKVQIPAGVENGMRIRLRGEGDAGARGGAPGDLYIVIFVQPHKTFERRGDDIMSEILISFAQAALGDTITVQSLDGEASLQIGAGTQTGTSFTLHGKGLPNLNSGARGDHYVVVRIVTPTKLNEEQKNLLLEFAKSTGEEVTPEENRTFFEKLLGK